MRKILVLIVLTFFLLPAAYSYGFSEKGQDCSKCHNLSKEEAANLLMNLGQTVNVLDVMQSPVAGVWEVDIVAGEKKVPIYIDFSKKHLITGSVISVNEKKNLSQERFTKLNPPPKVDVSQIPLDDALLMGDKDSKYKIVVFDDPDCPFCAKLHQEMKKVIAERKDIAFYIKLFPLSIHPDAYEKSKTIVCEKSLALLEAAFEKKEIPKAKCDAAVINDNMKLAQRLGITGTPALIFPDGRVIPGYKDARSIIELIGK